MKHSKEGTMRMHQKTTLGNIDGHYLLLYPLLQSIITYHYLQCPCHGTQH